MNENNTLTYDQETQLAGIFRPNADTGLAVNKLRSFLKNPEVQEVANSDLRQALIQQKIDVSYVVKERKQVITQAKKAKQFNAVNTALDRLEDHLGLNNKVKVTETREVNSNLANNFDNAVKETKKITIETTENGGKDSKKPVNNEDNEEKQSI